jgi:hypothetical protein
MAIDHDSLNNLTTTSVSTDISSGVLCGRNPTTDRLARLTNLWRLPLKPAERIDDMVECLAGDRTDPFPDVEQPD